MISRSVRAFVIALRFIQYHPQVLFALVLLLLIPLLFVYTGQQFLEVGRFNQDRLQKDRIGLLHDTFSSLLYATNFDIATAGKELSRLQAQNADLVDYAVVKKELTQFKYLLSAEETLIESAVEDPTLYVNASLRNDESLIFEFVESDARLWASYRAIENDAGEYYFLYTLFSLEHIDSLFKDREMKAYYSLAFVYLFIIALAYWHIRLTDYKYLFVKAQKTNEMKDIFTNMIAHELRSPLTAIRGYADLMYSSLAGGKEREQAKRISDSAVRLLEIINDLLDVARIQSGKMSVNPENIDASTIVKNVVDELRIMAQEKGISLDVTGADIPHTIEADPKRLYQALTNLVSNAIKYTPKGTIVLALEDKHAALELRVKDTGMGIGVEDQKKLFAPFFRVESQDVTQITGTGLGMWITKELIELMGGKIGVESIKGVGTHIVLSLPKQIRIH